MGRLQPGEVFADRFEIERTPPRPGGMATVYRARDRQAGGHVALKLLDRVGGREQIRFEREARLIRQLDHPGIVRYVDYGRTAAGVAWLAMEWLEGEDLAKRLRRERLSVDEAVALGRRAAEALGEAHAHGMVHRDITPNNLFLVERAIERVKVIDFGIAHGLCELGPTTPGTVIGTPYYMAPEQARGAPDVDARADVFSLGCVLFECLSGRPPFEGRHAMACLAKVLFEDPHPLRSMRPDVPAALERLIEHMLAKSPRERPAGGREVAAALAALATVEAAPAGGRRPSLTAAEQRIVSVIVSGGHVQADAETVSLVQSSEDAAALRLAVEPFGARLECLADGSVVAAIASNGVASDQAAHAARCALAMRDATTLGSVALATGLAVLDGELPVGEAIERAVALLHGEQRRPTGPADAPIILDEVTAGLLDARFEIVAGPRRRELLRERIASYEGPPTKMPFVGRDREIGELDALFRECSEESASRAVLVTGPPGIGKSRLGRELMFRLWARDEAADIWIAHGDPMGARSPRRMLAEMVARAARLLPRDSLRTKREKLLAHVEKSLAGEDAARVAEFLGELTGAPFPDEHRIQLQAARRDARLLGDQIRRALETLLAAACARGPVLFVLENLHWADAASMAIIDAAPRHLADRPLMVLGLARAELHQSFPGLWAARDPQEIRLAPLPRRASAELVRYALGDRATPATIARVTDWAAGNPFYLEEIVQAIAEGKGGALPGTVRVMVQARLEALSAEARSVLRAASIFGDTFWSGGVRALLGDSGAAADLDAALTELRRRDIVRRRESRFPGEEEHVFRHAIVREAAHDMLTERDRVVGHGLAGAWLEKAGERDGMILAEHFDRGGEQERAAVWYQRAAEQAFEANDLEAVIARTWRAEEIGAVGPVLGAALLLRGEANLWRGEPGEAGPSLGAAMLLLPRGGTLWFRAAIGSGWAASDTGDGKRVLALAAEIDEHMGAAPSPPALVAAACIARNLLACGAAESAAPFVARLSPALDDPACDAVVAAHVHDLVAMSARAGGDPLAARQSWQASAARFDEVGDVRQAVRVRVSAAVMLVRLGCFEQAEAELRAALAVVDDLGMRNMVVRAARIMEPDLRRSFLDDVPDGARTRP